MAGAEAPARMQGRSLVPLLRGESPEWRDAIYYRYYESGGHNVPRMYGVRTDRYKLIHYPETGERELFDLAQDPYELHSVHDDPAYAETLEAMEARLVGLEDRYQVPREVEEAVEGGA